MQILELSSLHTTTHAELIEANTSSATVDRKPKGRPSAHVPGILGGAGTGSWGELGTAASGENHISSQLGLPQSAWSMGLGGNQAGPQQQQDLASLQEQLNLLKQGMAVPKPNALQQGVPRPQYDTAAYPGALQRAIAQLGRPAQVLFLSPPRLKICLSPDRQGICACDHMALNIMWSWLQAFTQPGDTSATSHGFARHQAYVLSQSDMKIFLRGP